MALDPHKVREKLETEFEIEGEVWMSVREHIILYHLGLGLSQARATDYTDLLIARVAVSIAELAPAMSDPNTTSNGTPNPGGYSLTFAFPDQSPAFARGFTCGRIWELMSRREPMVFSMTVDADCRDTIEAMAMAKGWTEEITNIADGWIEIKMSSPGAQS